MTLFWQYTVICDLELYHLQEDGFSFKLELYILSRLIRKLYITKFYGFFDICHLTANKKNPSRHLDCLFYVSRLFYFKESKVCVFVMSRIVLCLVKYPLLHCELRYVERSWKWVLKWTTLIIALFVFVYV